MQTTSATKPDSNELPSPLQILEYAKALASQHGDSTWPAVAGVLAAQVWELRNKINRIQAYIQQIKED